MNIPTLFLILSAVIGFTTPLLGIYFILKGTFKPQRMTRFLIALIMMLMVGTLYAAKDTNGIYLASAQLLGTLILFIMSIKYGLGGRSKFDLLIFVMAICSLIIWQTTQNPILGLLMSIITDLVAYTPTLIKIWKLPHTEDWRFYLSDVVASTFSLLSITTFDLKTLAFPTYILAINTTSVVMILIRRKKYLP